MRGEAARLFVLELLLLLVFLPPFLLLPWGRTGLPAGPVVAVIGGIAAGVSLYALYAARRAEGREDWRAAAMLLGVGPGLWLWAGGIAFRLGDPGLALFAVFASVLSSLALLRFPEPPEEESAPRKPGE